MFAQLGTTQFDGLKSFVSYSEEEEVTLVEYARIQRKAKLQGTAIGLRVLTITLFLHQEFTNVTEEIAKLRASKNSFEILPLLWGNGQLEGEFLIQSSIKEIQQMDGLGNLISARVTITLKENESEDRLTQEQQAAKNNAFAVGDKKPPVKSSRVNLTPCPRHIANFITVIKGHAGSLDKQIAGYSGQPIVSARILADCDQIKNSAQAILAKTREIDNCVYQNNNIATRANQVYNTAETIKWDVSSLLFAKTKTDNQILQAFVRRLTEACNPIIQKAIVTK